MLATLPIATAVAAVAAVALLSPPAPVSPPAGVSASDQPSVRVLHDARHDVVGVSGPAGDQVVRSRREGDLIRFGVRYGEGTVRIRVRFDRLSRPDAREAVFVPIAVRTPDGDFVTGVTATGLDPQGEQWIEAGGDVACPGLAHRVRYGADTLTMVVPRSCLGDPSWVRVGVDALVSRTRSVWSDSMPGRSLGATRTSPRVWAPAA